MALYALVSGGAIIRRQAFDLGEEPVLASAKAMRWLLDEPPPFDAAKQTLSVGTVGVSDTALPYVVSDIPLDDVKAARKAALATKRFDVETGGITVGGAAVRTDRESQALITGAYNMVRDGYTSEVDFKGAVGWATLSGVQMTAIAVAVGQHVQACFSNEKTISASIDACTTADDVLAVDIEQGW